MGRCQVGDTVLHMGKEVMVSQVVEQGREEKHYPAKGTTKSRTEHARNANIIAVRVDTVTGKPLTRSPIRVGCDWQHVEQ